MKTLVNLETETFTVGGKLGKWVENIVEVKFHLNEPYPFVLFTTVSENVLVTLFNHQTSSIAFCFVVLLLSYVVAYLNKLSTIMLRLTSHKKI